MESILHTFNNFITNSFPTAISNPLSDINKEYFNRDIALENLFLFDAISQKYNLDYRIVFGTLLGIYRDNDLIEHDSDVDTAITTEQLPVLKMMIDELKSNGFNITRYSTNMLISLSRKGEYIDIYIFNKYTDDYNCNIYTLYSDDIYKPSIIQFKNTTFKTVNNIERFLIDNYGTDWKTPIKNKHANPNRKK